MSERIEELLMKATDGVLSAAESEELEALLEAHPERRAELEDYELIMGATDAMRDRIIAGAQIEPPRESASTFALLSLGWLLFFAGLCLIYGWALWALLSDPDTPWHVKGGVGLLGAGLALLFTHVARTRLRGLRHDPYSEIDR